MICGYLFQDHPPDWQPPGELEAFLDRGEPPVYVGFGSMGGQNPQRIARIVVEALAKSGHRGVLATGWGGMSVEDIPENVFALDAAPHGWLFPRMAAVIHHGGAGTTAEGLRAGVPTVIVPFIVDQLFWGNRVGELEAGPAPVQAKHLTAEKLASAIRTATTDVSIKQQAELIGQAIRGEDGIGKAVKIIQQALGE